MKVGKQPEGLRELQAFGTFGVSVNGNRSGVKLYSLRLRQISSITFPLSLRSIQEPHTVPDKASFAI